MGLTMGAPADVSPVRFNLNTCTGTSRALALCVLPAVQGRTSAGLSLTSRVPSLVVGLNDRHCVALGEQLLRNSQGVPVALPTDLLKAKTVVEGDLRTKRTNEPAQRHNRRSTREASSKPLS